MLLLTRAKNRLDSTLSFSFSLLSRGTIPVGLPIVAASTAVTDNSQHCGYGGGIFDSTSAESGADTA